jgi:energy-coupling factor transporter ATP-binding protein EcfA2
MAFSGEEQDHQNHRFRRHDPGQILELLGELRDRPSMGVLLVTQDLGVIAGHADRVLVMYAGRIVEAGPALPRSDTEHAYTCFHPRPTKPSTEQPVARTVTRPSDAGVSLAVTEGETLALSNDLSVLDE